MLVAGAKASAYGPVARALAFSSAFDDCWLLPMPEKCPPTWTWMYCLATEGHRQQQATIRQSISSTVHALQERTRSLPKSLPQHRNAATDGRG